MANNERTFHVFDLANDTEFQKTIKASSPVIIEFDKKMRKRSPNTIALNASIKTRQAIRSTNAVQDGHISKKVQSQHPKNFGVNFDRSRTIKRNKRLGHNKVFKSKIPQLKRIRNFAIAFGISATAIIGGINIINNHVNNSNTYNRYEQELNDLENTKILADELDLSQDTLLEYGALKLDLADMEKYPEDFSKDDISEKLNFLKDIGAQAFFEKFKTSYEENHPGETIISSSGLFDHTVNMKKSSAAVPDSEYFIEYTYEKNDDEISRQISNISSTTLDYIKAQERLSEILVEMSDYENLTTVQKADILKEVNNNIINKFDKRFIYNSKITDITLPTFDKSEKTVLPEEHDDR